MGRQPAARRLVDAVGGDGPAASPRGRFDHRGHYRRIRPVLEELSRTFFAAPASTRRDFERWLADDPTAAAYAAFRAATDQTRSGWHAWQAGPGALPPGVEVDGELARLHLYVQWTMRRQLADVARALAGRDQRLYLDLPVGAHGDGFDTWVDPQLYGWGCSVGAPTRRLLRRRTELGLPSDQSVGVAGPGARSPRCRPPASHVGGGDPASRPRDGVRAALLGARRCRCPRRRVRALPARRALRRALRRVASATTAASSVRISAR